MTPAAPARLELDPAVVRRARSLARTAAAPVVKLAQRHTTVSVERATLRLAGLAERAAVNLLTGRRRPADLAEGLFAPGTPLLALPVYRRAMRRKVAWKGREYEQ